MSKAQWLPGQLRGGVTHNPPKVVIEGVPPGHPATAELEQMLAPVIRGFHRQAAQNYDVGSVDQSKVRRQMPGLSMSYANMGGQEILHVKVSKELVEHVEKQVKGRLWNAAVVEVHVPETYTLDFTAEVLAVMEAPRTRNIEIDSPLPWYDADRGVYFTLGDPSIRRTVFSPWYAGASRTTPSSPQEVVASFALDWRTFPTDEVVQLKLYANLFAPYDPPEPYYRISPLTANPSAGDDPDRYDYNYPAENDGTFYPGESPVASPPEIYYDYTREKFVFVENDEQGVVLEYDITYDGQATPITIMKAWWVGTTPTTGYDGPTPVPTRVKVRTFVEPPPLRAEVLYRTTRSNIRWVTETLDPINFVWDFGAGMALSDATMPVGTLYNRLNMPLMGTLVFERRNGTVSYEPA